MKVTSLARDLRESLVGNDVDRRRPNRSRPLLRLTDEWRSVLEDGEIWKVKVTSLARDLRESLVGNNVDRSWKMQVVQQRLAQLLDRPILHERALERQGCE